MSNLTQKALEVLKSSDIGSRLVDGGGLTGKVRERRGKIIVQFEYRYRAKDKIRQIVCGTWPDISLKVIRDKRDEYRMSVNSGNDPLDLNQAARLRKQAEVAEAIATEQARLVELQSLKSRISVSELFERWVTVELIRRKDGGKEIRRMFEKDVLPLIGTLAVEDVRKGHITAVTDALLARGVTRMAKMIFSLIRQMFRFAVDRDIIEFDPSSSIRKAKIGGKETERDRVLSEDEIRQLTNALPSANLLKTSELAVWIALSTCCRIGELLAARWEYIDLEQRTWLIPAENSKNGKPHQVHLSAFSVSFFQQLQEMTGLSPWCYPNRAETGPLCSKTITKQLSDRQRPSNSGTMSNRTNNAQALCLPGGKWTPHDLRRTGATMMTALGVLPEVAERCLNHTEENRVKRTYQRHSYTKECSEAWEKLGSRLQDLTEPR